MRIFALITRCALIKSTVNEEPLIHEWVESKNDKLVCYINHHNKKTNEDSIECENISEAFNTLFKAVIMSVEIPNPNGTHNNRH